MFDNLSDKLQRVFKNMRGEGRLSAENMESALREVRVALLEADVNFKVVKQLIDQIRAKAVGQEVLTALSPGEQVIKIVRDELVNILGKDTAKLKFASQPPTVVLMAGLVVALIGFDPLRLTMLCTALTVIVMPTVVLPFLVLMNDDRYVNGHTNGPIRNGFLAALTVLAESRRR